MRCPVHCPPARSMLPRAVAVLAMAAVSSVAYAAVASVAEAVALAVLGACVPATWVTWRMVAYGSLRKPRAEAARLPAARLVRAPHRIAAVPLAIKAPPLTVVTPLAKVVIPQSDGSTTCHTRT